MTDRPRLLDLFCGAGGCTRGYQDAGFYVVGVDTKPQPHYVGDEFYQADAMSYPLDGFDVVHASPPCQDHSVMRHLSTYVERGTAHMLPYTRSRFDASGLPYVIENVGGAAMTNRVVLCGSSFGLGVRRHRQFESNVMLWNPPACRHELQPLPVDVTGVGGPGGRHRKPQSLAHAREVMGIDWMTRKELSQAIPPAYTRWIGEQLIAAIGLEASA